MKMKTSITLSKEVLEYVDRTARRGESRSEAIERLLREVSAERSRQERDSRDLTLINENAAELNEEAQRVLNYQLSLEAGPPLSS